MKRHKIYLNLKIIEALNTLNARSRTICSLVVDKNMPKIVISPCY